MKKLNDIDYLKRLIVTKSDLELYLYLFKDNDKYDYFIFKTEDFLEIINNEISFIKNKLSIKEKEYNSRLISIYNLGV